MVFMKKESLYFWLSIISAFLFCFIGVKYSLFSVNFNLLSNVIGIIGTFLIFKYGIPNKIDNNGQNFLLLETDNDTEKVEIQKYKNRSAIGLGLLLNSFIINIVNIYIKG
jgi:hypothetical protein